jgi:hypothetical protein
MEESAMLVRWAVAVRSHRQRAGAPMQRQNHKRPPNQRMFNWGVMIRRRRDAGEPEAAATLRQTNVLTDVLVRCAEGHIQFGQPSDRSI